MQYEEVLDRAPFSEKELLELCIKCNKTPKEFMKDYLKMASGLTDWRLAHREYGVMKNIDRTSVGESGVALVVSYQGRANKYNDGNQTGRTKIIQNQQMAEQLYSEWSQYIGKQCVFYISYQENKDDGSVYRVLMDVEGSGNQAPTPIAQNPAPASTTSNPF